MNNFILLPTGKPAVEGQILLGFDHQLEIAPYNQLVVHTSFLAQHLYHVSEDEIKAGDYFMTYHHNGSPADWEKCLEVSESKNKLWLDDGGSSYCEVEYAKKIVATTNSSIDLPLIPQETIQEYITWYNNQ